MTNLWIHCFISKGNRGWKYKEKRKDKITYQTLVEGVQVENGGNKNIEFIKFTKAFLSNGAQNETNIAWKLPKELSK